MKTSKRLLSIVLMLAMLVSMFTVMAFAGDKVKVTFDIGKDGTASIGNKTLKSREYSFTLEEINSAYVVVSPKSGYVADVMIGDTKLDQAQANYGFSLSSDMDGKTIKITFSGKDAGGEPEPTPDPEPSTNVNLRIGMWASDVQNAEILRDGKSLDITTAVSFTQEELNRGVTLTARADNKTYSVKWTLNEGAPVEGKTFTLPTDLKDGSKLFVEFTVDTKPEPETKHTLTVSSKDDSMGLIQYGENEKKSIDFSLEKKEKVTVKAVAKKGYEFVERELRRLHEVDGRRLFKILTGARRVGNIQIVKPRVERIEFRTGPNQIGSVRRVACAVRVVGRLDRDAFGLRVSCGDGCARDVCGNIQFTCVDQYTVG